MKKVRLGDICTVVSGTTPKSHVDEYWNGDKVWITPAEINEDTLVVTDSVRHISESAVKDSSLKSFPKGTVILSSRAPIGKMAIAGCEMYCNQGFKNLICSEKINNLYLLYFLRSRKNYLNSLGRGATFKEISKGIVENIKVPLPSMDTQIQIGNRIRTIEKLIGLRKKQLFLLDDLIKSRFVEMFGDPLENPYNFDVYLIKDLVIKSNNGISRRGKSSGGNIVLRLVELQDGFIDYAKPNRMLLTDSEKERFILHDNDVLFARVNGNPDRVGKCAVFYEIGEPVYHNDHIIRFHFDETKVNSTYLVILLNSKYGGIKIRSKIKTSAGQYTVSQEGIKSIEILLPPLKLQKQYDSIVHHIDKSKLAVQKSLEELEKLKNSLMQQYFD